jgi:hypothetical protein
MITNRYVQKKNRKEKEKKKEKERFICTKIRSPENKWGFVYGCADHLDRYIRL